MLVEKERETIVLTNVLSDDRLVKYMLQRWFSRICEDPFILQDEELRLFIESDFGVSMNDY